MKKIILTLSLSLFAILSFAASKGKETVQKSIELSVQKLSQITKQSKESITECICFTLITVPCHISTTMCYCGTPSAATLRRWIDATDAEVCGPQQ